jgi:hypothetical protein
MNMKTKNYNRFLLEKFHIKPIAYNVCLARIGGGVAAGLFMSQLVYWYGRGSDPEWIYKTIKEMKQETCLTRSQQDTAVRTWEELGVLECCVRRVPATRHFKINISQLVKLLEKENRFAISDKLKSNTLQTITESTSENTNQICSSFRTIARKDARKDTPDEMSVLSVSTDFYTRNDYK